MLSTKNILKTLTTITIFLTLTSCGETENMPNNPKVTPEITATQNESQIDPDITYTNETNNILSTVHEKSENKTDENHINNTESTNAADETQAVINPDVSAEENQNTAYGNNSADNNNNTTAVQESPSATTVQNSYEPAETTEAKTPARKELNSYEDNLWATFLVSPSVPAYTNQEDGYDILEILCNDSVIGNVATLSKNATAPDDTTAYGTNVITAGGPVSYSSLAYGRLSEVPDSFLNAMVSDMQSDIGYSYGGHSGGAGMGYRTFYQASYDADTGALQVNQSNGYWARTLGAFSEHCAGVAVDFDISYNNSYALESNGRNNREGYSAANEEFKWLADHAHEYGFIWRFKIDGSEQSANGNYTGTIREGWHWRFVGVYNATKFWEKCASDIDGDGDLEGYTTNDNYVWEDYFYSNIAGNSRYPQNEHEAFCDFYDTRCTYQQYINITNN